MTYSFVYLDSNNKLTNLNAFDFNLNTITVNNNSVLNGPLQVNNNVNISKNLNINGNLNVKEGFILPNKKNNNTIGSIYYDNTNHKFYGYYGDTNSWKNLGGIDNTLDTTISKNLNVLQNINVLGNINIDGDIIPDIHNKYSLTEGITEKVYNKIIEQIINKLPDLDEWLNPNILKKFDNLSWKQSILKLHDSKYIGKFKESF